MSIPPIRRRGSRISLVLGIVLAAAALLEASAGYWLAHRGDETDRARGLLEADSRLGWRQRANLNTTFEGLPLRTNEFGWRADSLPHGDIALLLGSSSAFGWGVAAEDTYAARLENSFREHGGGLHVVNAAEIGYSTAQGLLQLGGMAIKPKVLLLAFGYADVARHRPFWDNELADNEEWTRPHEGALPRSSLVLLARKISRHFRAAPFATPSTRVPASDFEKNLHRLAEAGRAAGSRVIFLGMAGNLPPYPPLSAEAEKRLAARFAEAVSLFEKSEYEPARLVFEEIMRLEPRRNEVYPYLREIAFHRGRRTEVRAYEEMGRLSEPFRTHRDLLAYNAILRRVAAAEKATFVDLYAEFPEADKSALFLDALHPSAAGHARIAAAIERVLR